MISYLQLYFEFFKIGLFSIGGGLATLPFIRELMNKTHWFTMSDITNMIAVSESTPGPFGVNMATYVGTISHGVFGGIVATLGLITPSIIIIILISRILTRFRDALIVKQIMYGLRPGSTGLVAVAVCSVAVAAVCDTDAFLASGQILDFFDFRALALAAVLFVLIKIFPKWHPVIFIAGAAFFGVLLRL